MSDWKYLQAAARVRRQIADGTLKPGEAAPSGAALRRATGFSALTCRKGLGTLLRDGVLMPGPSPNARPRVPPAGGTDALAADAARTALSAGLGILRRAAGLTQPELAALAGVSVTTVGHAETGRLWQSRDFWERADEALDAGGYLLSLHDDYRAALNPADAGQRLAPAVLTSALAAACADAVTAITIEWANGTVTTFRAQPPPATQPPCSAAPAPTATRLETCHQPLWRAACRMPTRQQSPSR